MIKTISDQEHILTCDWCGTDETVKLNNHDEEFDFAAGLGAEKGWRGWIIGYNWHKYSGIQFCFCSVAHKDLWQARESQ